MNETWWTSLYDDVLADMLLERGDPGHTAATVAFLRDKLQLELNARVFDQCCGIGSLSVPLAKLGCQVVGVDQAAGYIDRARRDGAAAGVEARFETADAFEYIAPEPCDGAFNWWTSFGYADTDAENLTMLARAFESLRPGAGFLLDTMNVPGLLRGFRSDVVIERETRRGRVTLWRSSSLDLCAGRIRKTWTYFLPDGERRSHDTSVRLYMPHNLAELFSQAGFVDIQLFGSVAGEAVALDSPRCIVLGRRPE